MRVADRTSDSALAKPTLHGDNEDRIHNFVFSFATMPLACCPPAARADATNAFVTVRAVDADVKRMDGRNFAASEDGEVEIVAQPGWVLLTPNRVRVTKNESPRYRVRSVSNEDDGGGDIMSVSSVSEQEHLSSPVVTASIVVAAERVFPEESDESDAATNGSTKMRKGSKFQESKPGAAASISGTATIDEPGKHRIKTTKTYRRNGIVVDREVFFSDEYPVEPDSWEWEYSFGKSGTANSRDFQDDDIVLPKGKHKAAATVRASNTKCTACTASDSASDEVEVSRLSFRCGRWIGLDRTGMPSDTYESKPVVASATVDAPVPDLGVVFFGYSGFCTMVPGAGWSRLIYATSREQSSSSFGDQIVSASLAGSRPAMGRFTVVKVDVSLQGLSEREEETQGGVVPLSGKQDDATKMLVKFTCHPQLPDDETVAIKLSESDYLLEKTANGFAKASDEYKACEINGKEFVLCGVSASETLRDRTISIEHVKSGAKDRVKYTVFDVELEQTALWPEDRHRTKMGVGETFVASIVPATRAKWKESNGYWNLDAALNDSSSFGSKMFGQAKDATGRGSISAKVGSVTVCRPVELVAPEKIHSSKPSNNQSFSSGVICVLGRINPIVVGPVDVSFSNVEIIEGECPAEGIKGYYKEVSPILLSHFCVKGAEEPAKLGDSNNYLDDVGIKLRDELTLSDLKDENGYEWNIPISWRVVKAQKADDGIHVNLTNDTTPYHNCPFNGHEKFVITKNGTANATKFKITFTRTINNIRSETLEQE